MKQRFLVNVTLARFAFAASVGYFLVWPLYAYAAPNAALFLNPASGTFLVGSTFDLSVVLDTKGVAINTVEVELLFPADRIQLASPSVGRSIIQVWPAPPVFSNREGRMYFVGGIPSPGIVTSQGVVLTLTFRVVAPGRGEFRFGPKSSVLANDGRGTNILTQHPSAFFEFIVPPPQGPVISSPTHPDQERWYKDTNPVFLWPKSPFSDGYSFAVDRDPAGFPDTVVDGTVPTASFSNIANGLWYFHLRERAGGVWGGVSHYVVKIDSDLPASFRVLVSPSRRTTNRNPIFRFFTTDALSGLDHYEMKIIPLSGGEVSESLFFEVTSPYQAPNFTLGRHQVIVRALDRAGNGRDETVTMQIVSSITQFINPEGLDLVFVFIPWSSVVLVAFSLLALFLFFLLLLWRKHQHHLRHAFREDLKKFSTLLHLFGRKGPLAVFFLAVGATLLVSFYPFDDARAESPPPSINVAPTQYYPLDDILYLEGKSLPRAKVELFFERVGGGAPPVRVRVDANSAGEWFFSEKLGIASGEWMVRARVLGEPPSDWSGPRVFRSVVSGFLFGGVKIRYLPIVLVFLFLFLAGGSLLVYSIARVRTVERREFEEEMRAKTETLERELKEKEREVAETLVEQNFADLRKNVLEELHHLERKLRDGEALSREEEEHRERLMRQLRSVEEEIEKKIRG